MKGGWKQFCWMGKRWKVEALSDDGALPTSQLSSHCEPCPFLSFPFPSLPLLVPIVPFLSLLLPFPISILTSHVLSL